MATKVVESYIKNCLQEINNLYGTDREFSAVHSCDVNRRKKDDVPYVYLFPKQF
jgi:hypothetical protein